LSQLQAIGSLPREVSAAELAVMFEVYYANIRIPRDYRSASAIRGPIHLISASELPRANEEHWIEAGRN
jgi:hypothetical protein